MSRLLVACVVVALVAVGTGSARADGCEAPTVTRDGEVIFRVCGEAERPHAMYVIPRARGERYVPELRRSTASEIVRDADSL
jgi:hypothetical protein